MLNTSSQARQLFIRLGGHSGLVDAYLAAVTGIMGVAAAGYAVAAVLRLHAEESERRAGDRGAGPGRGGRAARSALWWPAPVPRACSGGGGRARRLGAGR